ncbi:recombination hotspot binding protein [Scheffersomyces xylosifermentans]|uniref:recombination hotspot binding protein n=1 Tax=Scheffersomyces xylosifermentans TaxID=1304137 RepID=UPI00315CE3BE
MSNPVQFQDAFASIKKEIELENESKEKLQELEASLLSRIADYKSSVNNALLYTPVELFKSKILLQDSEVYEKLNSSLKQSLAELEEQECKRIMKERAYHKFMEEVIYLFLVDNYLQQLVSSFKDVDDSTSKVSIGALANSRYHGVGEPQGLVLIPKAINEEIGIDVDYNDYLLALLRLVDIIVEYTTNTIIRVSISSSSIDTQYVLTVINQQLIGQLQQGFQNLDLKNDNLRRKFDGLKYSYKKINGIVYDLSLRNLIKIEGDVN